MLVNDNYYFVLKPVIVTFVDTQLNGTINKYQKIWSLTLYVPMFLTIQAHNFYFLLFLLASITFYRVKKMTKQLGFIYAIPLYKTDISLTECFKKAINNLAFIAFHSNLKAK